MTRCDAQADGVELASAASESTASGMQAWMGYTNDDRNDFLSFELQPTLGAGNTVDLAVKIGSEPLPAKPPAP